MQPPGGLRLSAAELQRQRLLEGPILPTLLSIAWPTMVQMLAYSAVLLLETWFISMLGVTALAGASLVSPAMFLMQAMAAGGLGGAVSATIARAAGSGNRSQVQSLAWHAIAIGLALGLAFAAGMVLCGPWFYRLLGGQGATLAAALAYSNVLFLGAPLMWLVVILAAILRGLGVTRVQAAITVFSSVILLPLSPLLIFGAGPFAGFGMRGAAIAVICYYALVAAIYCLFLLSDKSVLRLDWRSIAPSRADFAAILRIGGISSLLAVQSHVTALIITGLAGGFGTVVLAGFGTAMRLQHVVEPFLFSLGTATVVTVATCIGAGKLDRARQVAMTAAIAATVLCGVVGGVSALAPGLWMDLFTDQPEVAAAGALYLRTVGPVYWSLGLSMMLYYWSQGAGRMFWSYAGSVTRLVITATVGSAVLTIWRGDVGMLYLVVAAGMLASCGVTAAGIALSDARLALSAKVAGTAR